MKTQSYYIFLIMASSLLLACSHKEKSKLIVKYTCSMHPQIIRDEPGACPICKMDLVPLSSVENDGIVLNQNQIALGNIHTAPASRHNIRNQKIISGRLVSSSEQINVITSRVNGRIEKLFYKEAGARVKKGEALYTLFSEELQSLQQEYLLMQHESEQDQSYKVLLEATENKLLRYGMTKDEIQQLKTKRDKSLAVTFRADRAAIITSIDAAEGEYVEEGSAVYKIENLGKLWLEADLYPEEVSLVDVGDSIQVIFAGGDHNILRARVDFKNPAANSQTSVVTIRSEISNNANLSPGMQANILLSLKGNNSITLPGDAIIHLPKSNLVWIYQDGKFKPRKVKTGVENFETVEVTEGLNENDTVVTTGAYLLYSEWLLKKDETSITGL